MDINDLLIAKTHFTQSLLNVNKTLLKFELFTIYKQINR